MPRVENVFLFKTALQFKAHHKLASDGYDVVFKTGKRVKTRCLQFTYTQDPSQLPLLGLAISKKNVNSAVKRNLCKRLAREYFRKNQTITTPLQVIVMAYPPAAAASREELHACFTQFWQLFKKQ